jgi:sulfur-oxidizing protein SoxY
MTFLTKPPRATRRDVVIGVATIPAAQFVTGMMPGSARASQPMNMEAAIREFVGPGSVLDGKVKLEIPPLVDNGNSVTLTVSVESPMSPADYVKRIAVFNEKNPQPQVAVFHLGPRSGKAQVQTRIRLATSQKLVAIAQLSDGSFWSASAESIVTLAACLEG